CADRLNPPFHIADSILGPENCRRLGIRSKDDLPPGTVGLVGSLIAAVTHAPCIVVGGGLINGNRRTYGPDCEIRAVRGFLTKTTIMRDAGQNPEVIGDPGLLLAEIEPAPEVHDRKPLGFIVHAQDREMFLDRYPQHAQDIVDNYAPREEFVRQLAECEMIASTSLHGCIFAHSYGVPVAPFVLSDQLYGGDFKFQDHYSALGFDVQRRNMPETIDKIVSIIDSTPQPDDKQLQRLVDRQWTVIREALTSTGG
ncbi:polysaccharide pyruvyl transferase family protein, partial [Kocuria coralli]|uniref:polysaccharide pyruvyl transferase family protein n=1 Tax=Kocuria coralli TaxID=1461025 RepID=UPI001C70A5B5